MNREQLIRDYYGAFNRKDMKTFLSMLHDGVVHDLNQGPRQVGKAAFSEFMTEMNRCYDEKVENLTVMVDSSGRRAAAEFTILGRYLQSQAGLPAANGQTYNLPVGAFFEFENGLVKRITNYYNLPDWIKQVGG